VLTNFDPVSLLAILPEILIVALAGFVLLFDALWTPEKRRWLGWLTAGGLIAIALIALAVARPGEEARMVFGGMIRDDWLGFVFRLLFLVGAAVTSLLAMDVERLGRRGEFYLLLLASTLGMNLMASAGDLVMLYLAFETTSIPLYVLAGFFREDDKSTEAGFKYLLFGALTSTVMLYGLSLLYGFGGTTNLYELAEKFLQAQLPLPSLLGSLVLVLVGFGFKVSAVPLHFWAPDVYEGAPTPVAGFLSTASKAAGFAVLARVLFAVFPQLADSWVTIIAVLAVLTMTLGNLLALPQKNIKRLLAYSSIAHAGYMLIGVAAISATGQNLGLTGVVFYLIAYLLTNLAAFGAVAAVGRVIGSDEIAAYAGLSRRKPGLAFVMLVAFLSLAGMPPLGGFIGKIFVFAAAVRADLIWLAFVGVINSIVGLYYYLTVLKVVYLYRPANLADEQLPLPLPRPYALGLTALTLGIVLLGTLFAPWFNWASVATASLVK